MGGGKAAVNRGRLIESAGLSLRFGGASAQSQAFVSPGTDENAVAPGAFTAKAGQAAFDEWSGLQKINADSGAITTEEALEYIAEFEDALEEGDFDRIRFIIESLIFYIELDNDDVYIHWKFA